MKRANVFGKANIIVGDTTTHGGLVIKGCTTATWSGMQVARVGDLVFCPKCGGGIFPIIEGESRVNVMGQPIAVEGNKTGCRAELIAVQASTNVVDLYKNLQQATDNKSYDEHFIIQDKKGNAVDNLEYEISSNKDKLSYSTDSEGKTTKIHSSSQETINLNYVIQTEIKDIK